MIIDDTHQVVFVHIPKCGGTSVRRQLALLDSYAGAFYGRKPHARLGELDYCHIPLPFLRSDFPVEMEKVERYRAFALVRDPHARFVSATFERLALFGGVRRTTATAEIALQAAGEAIRWLEPRESFSDPGYIHFARQADYICLAGRRVVDNVYPLDDLQAFGAELQRLTGAEFDAARRENTNFASPSRALTILHAAKPIYSRVTTWRQREKILKLMHRWKLQSPDALYAAFRKDPTISSFVESYYADDLALYKAAKARSAAKARKDDAVHVASPLVGAESA